MPLGGIFSRSRGERSRGHSRTLSSPNTTLFTSEPEPPSTPRPNRTRARTLLTSPHTPLSKIFTSFGGRGGESWKKSLTKPQFAEHFTRPGTASSAYSSSSNSSFESMHTTATECTIPDAFDEEDDDDDETEYEKDEPKLGPAFSEGVAPGTTSNISGEEGKKKYQEREGIGARDVEWTDEMDGHLWKTYMLYQNDPTVTPFYVPPGGVPPLGVCLRVARVAKSTWKGSKSGNSRILFARAPTTPTKGEPRLAANKADLMRKSSSLKWPASESSSRKRLRLLCRRGYGPSKNPYHNHRQDPTQFRHPSRLGANRLPSGPLAPIEDDDGDDDAEDSDRSVSNALLASTRSMALSLATSTSVSMRPDSTMAAISGGSPLPNLAELETRNQDPLPEFRGFTDASGNAPPVAVVLATVGLGHPVFPRPTPTVNSQPLHTPLYARRARANTTIEPPVGMPSLQLSSSLPSHGSWPQRGLRPEETAGSVSGFDDPLPGPSAPLRHSVDGVFDGVPLLAEPTTPQAVPQTPPPRTRQRGYTVNIGPSNGLNGKRRARPSDISTPLPSWAYESVEGNSERPNLAQLFSAQPLSAGAPRLGSPFVEDNTSKGKWRSTLESLEFGPPLPKKSSTFINGAAIGPDARRGSHQSTEEDGGRPMKRIRE